MTEARFAVSLSTERWLGDVSSAFPETTFRVRSGAAGDSRGVWLCWLLAPEVAPVIDALDRHEGVDRLTVLSRTETEAAIQCTDEGGGLLCRAFETETSVEFPVDVTGGRAVIDAVGEAGRLTAFGRLLEAEETAFEIESLRTHTAPYDRLTHQQHALVTTALERGYYDTPRECSLTELAAAVGLAKSTVSETLHRAEGAIIKSALKLADAPVSSAPGSTR